MRNNLMRLLYSNLYYFTEVVIDERSGDDLKYCIICLYIDERRLEKLRNYKIRLKLIRVIEFINVKVSKVG